MSRFKTFLQYFQQQEPPIILGEEASAAFSRQNKPLPLEAIQEFILPYETEVDDYTEIVPGILMKYNDLNLIIYWKASLLHYQYILMIFDDNGQFLDRSVVGGTIIEENTLFRSAARIDEDFVINIASSRSNTHDTTPTPGYHQNFTLEVDENGCINTIQ